MKHPVLIRAWIAVVATVGLAVFPVGLPIDLFGPNVASVQAADNADPLDWSYWRGPEQNGISRETGLPDKWDHRGGDGSNLAWKRKDLGGRSTPIVMRGKLYTLVRDNPGTPEEGEKVACVDYKTGETVWEHRFNVWSSDVPDTRVGWSSVVGDPATGLVYAQGVCGYFVCLNGEDGKVVWSRALHEEFGLLSTYGGRTNFPVICDDLVIISAVIIGWGEMARPAHRILGFNKLTGETVWFTSTTPLPEDTTYSSPIVTVLNGQKAFVIGAGDGRVWALQPRTGKPIWSLYFSRRGLNVPPLVDGNNIYMGHSEENITGTAMGALALLDGSKTGDITKTGTQWKVEELGVGKSAILKVEDRLYCFDDAGKLWVVDAKTGDKIGRRQSVGTMNRSSPLYADGKIYHTEANGRWWIFTPDDKAGVKVAAKGNFDTGEECNASPIASHGRVFVQTSEALYCFADAGKKPGSTPIPAAVVESPAEEDQTPALVQVVPCEALLRPGTTQKFTVRLFNARGQFLKQATDATFSLEGAGEIAADGSFQVPESTGHVATYVTAKVGELSGRARVRIVPPLPWKFDFEGLTDAPITWVGARYRHVVRKVDGNSVMVKITTIPKGTRSRCWFGQSDLHDYTIQADMKAAPSAKMPDMGLIAQGYTFELQGEAQMLFLTSWVSHDHRHFRRIKFEWKPDTWYTIKFQASNDGDKAIVRGKVWPKDSPEPAEWTVEMSDPRPNKTGSPGLFGNATNAEVFIDNVVVTPNEK